MFFSFIQTLFLFTQIHVLCTMYVCHDYSCNKKWLVNDVTSEQHSGIITKHQTGLIPIYHWYITVCNSFAGITAFKVWVKNCSCLTEIDVMDGWLCLSGQGLHVHHFYLDIFCILLYPETIVKVINNLLQITWYHQKHRTQSSPADI